jgi:hypothetical protein
LIGVRGVDGEGSEEFSGGGVGWAVHHARRRVAELIVVFVVSSSFEWELNAAQVNTDPIGKELRRRLRGEWTEPVRAGTSGTRLGSRSDVLPKLCSTRSAAMRLRSLSSV